MNGPESTFRSWLRKADHDLLNIRNNLVAERVPWDTVCYHAQQAAEKTLKGFLIRHGKNAPHTHDLVVLLTECVELSADLSDLEEDCRNLTYFAVGSRYPDDLYEPGESDGRAMVAATERIRARLLSLIEEE